MNKNKARRYLVETIISTKQFKLGVADYHAGMWREVTTHNRSMDGMHLYETGRLVAAATGRKLIRELDYVAAIRDGALPTSKA